MLLAAYALLRIALLRSLPLDSDEPQHLHVVWAWSRGLVPYRDVFDNHAPLFHILYAPLLRLLGETPDVLPWMRLAILPLSLAAIALAAATGCRLWDRRVALSGALLVCAFPPYLISSGQFRADALWALAWIAAAWVAVARPWSTRRAFVVGMLVGAAFASSMKTTMLLAGALVAWGMVYAAMPRRLHPGMAAMLRDAGAMVAGAALVPAIVVGWVALQGGASAMLYGVVEHNLLPALGRTEGQEWRMLGLLPTMAAMAMLVRRTITASSEPWLTARRCLVVCSALAYVLLMFGFWPLLTRQDLQPALPLLAIGLAGWCLGSAPRVLAWAPATASALGLAIVVYHHPPGDDRLASYRAELADVLAITGPRDMVMDGKGASVYRMRPFYLAYEDITLERIRRGLVRDDLPQRLVATDTHLVWPQRLPAADMRFVVAHYVPLRDGLMAAGKVLGRIRGGTSAPVSILLPGRYAVEGGPRAGGIRIDGSPCRGSCWLGGGRHVLDFARGGYYELVWKPAVALLPSPAREAPR